MNKIEAGTGQITINIKNNKDPKTIRQYLLEVLSKENDTFNAGAGNIVINIDRQDYVTVNKDKKPSSIVANTLQEAINMVRDNGIIIVETDIESETAIINKNISIKGNAKIITSTITNDGDAFIEGLTFQNSPITNNNTLKLDSCTFSNSNNSAILTNNNLEVVECVFTNNTAQYGACIYIQNKDNTTLIDGCTFNENNAQYYGGCIYSNKGNNIIIQNSEFSKSNSANNNGSCISIYGKAYISGNTFYENGGKNEIYLMNGNIDMDKNIFDGRIPSINILHGDIDADLNYWGYNTIEEILNNSGIKSVNNYLISRVTTERKDENNYYVTGIIDQYKNEYEVETTTINAIESPLPVYVGALSSSLNKKEIAVSSSCVMTIGMAEVEVKV